MANQKTRKVLDIQVEGKHFVCIRDNETMTYTLYEKWWENNKYGYPTERRKAIGGYAMFYSVIDHLRKYALSNNWGF